MSDKVVFKESVRGLIEYILKSGSLDDRFLSRGRALEGTVAHGKLQKSNAEIYKEYEKEVKLNYEFQREDVILQVEGRADGIIKDNGNVIIEEIKSTYKNLIYIDEDFNELHWAQGKVYAYIYCKLNSMTKIYIRLSYYNINTDEVRSFEKKFQIKELEEYTYEIIYKYLDDIILKNNLKIIRNKSIENLSFPFESYRKGQRELAINCYNSIKQNGVLFVQAPTGIGKTISTIFPAVKSIGEGRGEKIIYLTAKTITRSVAEEGFIKLLNNGLKFKVVTITAKEKMCLNSEVKCNPDDCIYARDYFTKINDVIKKLIARENIFTRTKVIEYAKEFNLCPFELSLDLTEWCDSVICDYNYAFDPRVRLRRIFEDHNSENILLVDEAHNLVDRARNMYSCEILKSKVMDASKILKGKVPNLYKIVNLINKEMINIRRELEEVNENVTYKNIIYKDLIKLLRMFINEAEEYLIKSKGTSGYENILEFYYDTRNFIALSELYSKEYTTILKNSRNEFSIKIFCIDPSKNLSKIVNSAYSTVIFSATLSPIKYYVDLLGGEENSFRVRFNSPFNKENLQIYIKDLDMRYASRDKNIIEVCKNINRFVQEKQGNYIVFLPSFDYLNKVYKEYVRIYGDENILLQEENLSEEKKEEFLSNFKIGANKIGFSVVGGMFSEGVDLPGERLIGAVVVGVGFPRISVENNIIAEYFEQNGFDYSYTYPGMNKVFQSVGRVIRTETDKGRVLLIDNRYLNNKYKRMLPQEWNIKLYK